MELISKEEAVSCNTTCE